MTERETHFCPFGSWDNLIHPHSMSSPPFLQGAGSTLHAKMRITTQRAWFVVSERTRARSPFVEDELRV